MRVVASKNQTNERDSPVGPEKRNDRKKLIDELDSGSSPE
jgi:hypothetical protein